MPPDPTSSPAATAAGALSASSTPGSAATAVSDSSPNSHDFDSIFSAAMAGLPADDPREPTDPPALKRDGEPAAPGATAVDDGKPASDSPTERVPSSKPDTEQAGEAKATEDAETSSRRQHVGAGKDATIESLRQQLVDAQAAVDVDKIRADLRAEIEVENERKAEEARQASLTEAQRAEFERFERLNRLPDDAPELAENDHANWHWLQEYKRKLNVDPEGREHAERHYRAEAERVIAERQAQMETQNGAFWVDVRSQITESAQKHGVDPDAWKKPGTTWAQMADDIGEARYQAGKAEAEKALLARVEAAEADASAARKDAEELRNASLGQTRAPANAGRSSSVATERPTAQTGGSFEENMNLAFGWGQK